MARDTDGRPALDRPADPVADLVGWLARRDTIRRFDPDAELLADCFAAMDERYADDPGRTWDGTLERYWGPDGFMNEREAVLARALRRQGFFAHAGVDEPRTDGTAPDPVGRWG
jgi:hypothetical protein